MCVTLFFILATQSSEFKLHCLCKSRDSYQNKDGLEYVNIFYVY